MNEFFEHMQSLIGARYAEFKAAYDGKPRFKALRVNTLKISTDEFCALFGGALERNGLCAQSFYCEVKPSLDPLYHAGLYYMQEPSASAAVAAFAPYIGERVLDLCAAPGGKATQAAAVMDGRGIIFCNDPEYKRVRALTENIERLGVRNAVITCNAADDYVRAGFEGFFDTLIVDAPCSGGGMTRYEVVPYSRDIVRGCAERQRAILVQAVKLLAAGGRMLYSTCTFSREENEQSVEFLQSLGLKTVDVPLRAGEERGIGIADARRIYPHNFDGEGHFYCVLEKSNGGATQPRPPLRGKPRRVKVGGATLDAVEFDGRLTLPISPPRLDGLNAVRIGVPIFNDKGEPTHALSHALTRNQVAETGVAELGAAAVEYLKGGELKLYVPRGIVAATACGHALGWARSARTGDGESALKNLYPKALRI